MLSRDLCDNEEFMVIRFRKPKLTLCENQKVRIRFNFNRPVITSLSVHQFVALVLELTLCQTPAIVHPKLVARRVLFHVLELQSGLARRFLFLCIQMRWIVLLDDSREDHVAVLLLHQLVAAECYPKHNARDRNCCTLSDAVHAVEVLLGSLLCKLRRRFALAMLSTRGYDLERCEIELQSALPLHVVLYVVLAAE